MSAGGDNLPGFSGLLLLGYTDREAWQIIRDATVADPDAVSIIRIMAGTDEGREALALSGAAWAARGLPAPWAELLEGGADGTI